LAAISTESGVAVALGGAVHVGVAVAVDAEGRRLDAVRIARRTPLLATDAAAIGIRRSCQIIELKWDIIFISVCEKGFGQTHIIVDNEISDAAVEGADALELWRVLPAVGDCDAADLHRVDDVQSFVVVVRSLRHATRTVVRRPLPGAGRLLQLLAVVHNQFQVLKGQLC
jgi:hypothetical protein